MAAKRTNDYYNWPYYNLLETSGYGRRKIVAEPSDNVNVLWKVRMLNRWEKQAN